MKHTLTAEESAYLKQTRESLHQIPELAFNEYKTAQFIENELKKHNIPYQKGYAGTGIIAEIKGAQKGKTIAFRADMDALPIEEQTNIPYRSKHPNTMHACGHDTHMAMLLTAGKILNQQKDKLKGNLKLIFQPAEEMRAGGKTLIQDGGLKNIDECYAFHVWPELPCGSIGIKKGALMASMDAFKITLIGKSGHGAAPQQGIDAIYGGAQLINALQSIVSRETDPLDACVIAIGSLQAGQSSNIIAEKAELLGNIRAIDPNTREQAKQSLKRITQAIAKAHRLQAQIDYLSDYPITINHAEQIEHIEKILKNHLPHLTPCQLEKPSMASEDFAYYLEKTKGAFLFLGVNDGAAGSYKLHHEKFLPPTSALEHGVEIYLQLAYHNE